MSKKILIIDDEENFVQVLKARLENSGYSVVYAYDGESGIKKAQGEKPDLILLDIMLPGMDGYTTLKLMKENEATSSIPVVVLTCKEKMGDLFTAEGVKGYIVKPYDKNELLGKIKEALGDSDQ